MRRAFFSAMALTASFAAVIGAPGIAAPVPAVASAGLRCSGNGLVHLLELEPRPLIELRYASPYNFLGSTLYPELAPQLRCPVALALQQVQRDLAAEGLGLKLWDAYRPLAVQQQMWNAIRDPRYVGRQWSAEAFAPSPPSGGTLIGRIGSASRWCVLEIAIEA